MSDQPLLLKAVPASSGSASGGASSFAGGTGRLQVVALLMAGGCVLVNLDVVLRDRLEAELAHVMNWLTDVVTIGVSLLVFALARYSKLSLRALVAIGLVYEVLISFSITYQQFWGMLPPTVDLDPIGLGWVAPWVIVFAVVVPTRPWKGALASLASVSAVPITVGASIAAGASPPFPPGAFIGALIVPYLVVVATAFFVTTVVYQLGREVTKARQLGSYELERCIGRGGMGEVWRAKHRMLARPAAVKLVRADRLGGDAESAAALARFEREAEVTAALQSPHTVQLYDYGISEDGVLYYVMEYLDGIDLELAVRLFGPMPEERVLHILKQACESLGEAHRHGLVHRDIKPSNLTIGRFALEHDFVKVLDFGLVKRQAKVVSPHPELSDGSTVTGTPAFMAPEVILGDELDGRVDVYSLGCVAYWLLTAELVFPEEKAMSMLIAHVKEPPVPPSKRSALPISPALDDLVLACLAKDPAGRPRSAEELSARLAEIEPASPWTERRAAEWWEEYAPRPGSAGVERVSVTVPTVAVGDAREDLETPVGSSGQVRRGAADAAR